LHRASAYAARISPHGAGRGRPGDKTQRSDDSKGNTFGAQSPDGKAQTDGGRQQNQTLPARMSNIRPDCSAAARQSIFRKAPLDFTAGSEFYFIWRGRFDRLVGDSPTRPDSPNCASFLAALAQFFRDFFMCVRG